MEAAVCHRLTGSADLLEALNVNIDLSPEQIARSIEEVGIGFMYAPNHHAAMRHAKAVREELGVRTIFNILGPLTNPAYADNIMMGVFHPDLVGIQVRVLQKMGLKRALVVWGRDNLDEISLGASTLVGELSNGKVREYDIHPEDFGIRMYASRNFQVGQCRRIQADRSGYAEQQADPGGRYHCPECRCGIVCCR